MNITSHRIAVALVATLAAVAISAPLAQGMRPDDRALHGVGPVTVSPAVPDVFERAVRAHTNGFDTLPGVFERAVARGRAGSASRPDDRSGVRGPGLVASSPLTSLSTGQGFAWGDAALGAGAMLALCCLLAAGGLALTRQQRKLALR